MQESNLVTDQKINWKELPFYDHSQVCQLLAVLPHSIYKAARARDTAAEKLDRLKHDLKVLLAQKHLIARHMDDLKSNDDRKAWAVTQPEVISMEVAIIEADGALAVHKLNVDRLENWFTAVRKIASMMTEEDKAVHNTTKYGSPPDDLDPQ